MKFRKLSIVFLFLFFCLNVVSATPFSYSTISIQEIEQSLPPQPVSVGFDVDDTVLFSSPGFHYAFTNTDGPNKTNKYGPKPLNSDKFWEDMSSYFDKFSIPKESARQVIEMHKKRNDKIFFITARPKPQKEIVTQLLSQYFSLPKNTPPVIFSGKITKCNSIKQHNIVVFYGDSDTDISEAHDAGIRAIRFMRSPLSTNKGRYKPGIYGEAVLENSEN